MATINGNSKGSADMTAEEIEEILKKLGAPDIANHSQRFFKTKAGDYGEGDMFLGIRVPVLRDYAKKYQTTPINQALILLRSAYHEIRLFALLLLVQGFTKGSADAKAEIYECYIQNTEYINNWDLVDSSAPQIVGAYLENKDRQYVYTLANSPSLWERRIAIMATFHWIKNNDFQDALSISQRLKCDSEDLIHKAVGWMLREIGKRDRAAETAFLTAHYSEMPRTMLRYAIEKFPAAERQRYLKGLV